MSYLMNKQRSTSIILLFILSACVYFATRTCVYAQDELSRPSSVKNNEHVQPAESPPEHGDAQEMQRLWEELLKSYALADYAQMSDRISQIIILRDSLGIRDLPRYAEVLIEHGRALLAANQRDEARLFYRWAFKLAGNSPEILWSVLPFASQFGIDSTTRVFKRALEETFFSPFRVLNILHLSIYPLLFSLSVALVISFVLIFCAQIMEIFRVMAWRIKPEKRGWLIPLLFISAVCIPLCFGLLWCLVCWSVVLYVLLPEKRFLSLTVGLVILAWGVLTPLRENIASWIADPQVRRVVLAGEQPLTTNELLPLKAMMSEWQSDVVVQFKFAQLLRRAGEHQQATKLINGLEMSLGEKSWVIAERGVLQFLSGEIGAAEKSVRRAVDLDARSPEAFFNLSKIVFENSETKESRELFGKALKLNKSRVESMRLREDVLGIHDPRSFADVELPMYEYFSAALVPNARSFDRAHEVIGRWMWGVDPRLASLVGLIVLMMHLIPRHRSRRINPKGLFDGYGSGVISNLAVRIIPAGYAIVGSKIRSGFFILSAMIFAIVPLIRGSYDAGHTMERLGWLMPYHFCAVALCYLVFTFVAISKLER